MFADVSGGQGPLQEPAEVREVSAVHQQGLLLQEDSVRVREEQRPEGLSGHSVSAGQSQEVPGQQVPRVE